MFCKFLLALSLSIFSVFAAAETVEVDYRYSGEHGVDFSSMPAGPLEVAEFVDGRELEANTLTASGNNNVRLDRTVAELVRSAFVQGFESGGAKLANDGGALELRGEVLEASTDVNNGQIQITLRSKVGLHKGDSNREVYGTTAFGRGSASDKEGFAAALSESLDALVNSLLWDDYFLMQVVD